MSRARHEMEHEHRKHHAEGGKVEPELHPKPYNAEGSNVEKEADEKKRGGRAKKKDGGRMHHMEHHVDGEHKKHRLDRPGRKAGGRVGSDKSPLTSAANVRDAKDHKAEEGNADEGP